MFRLEKYFDSIGLKNFKPHTDLTTLEIIIKHHLAKFIYQNGTLYKEGKKSISERSIPSLEKDALFEKMVLDNQPGYCFQQLELIAAVLEACGFSLNRCLAKILLKPSHQIEEEKLKDVLISHEVITINLDDKFYIVDVGMANSCLRKPLLFIEGEQHLESDLYRLTKFEQEWRLDIKNNNEWCVAT